MRKLIRFCLAFSLLSVSSAGGASALCETSEWKGAFSGAKRAGLELSARAHRANYAKTDVLKLKVVLKNKTVDDIYVPGRLGFADNVSVRIEERPSGEKVKTAFVPNSLPPPPASAADLLKIPACGSVIDGVSISLRDFDVRAGGKYDVVVDYRSSLPGRRLFGRDVIGSEQGVLAASAIPIKISGR
ncbi:MAG: hypothetical protein ACJ8HI_14420 [Massilia sp.]